MSTTEQQDVTARVSEVFSPAAPINRRDLFAGRINQLERVFDAVNTRGQHAAIFGERGVGKTSLANIVKEIASIKFTDAVAKINCAKAETFSSIWRKVLSQIHLLIDNGQATVSFKAEPARHRATAADDLPEQITPLGILGAVECIEQSLFIFDEFDRLGSGQEQFADVIKTLSDASVNCTLVMVGVANNIDDLIREHASIDRSLVQILMPRMTSTELHEILNKAMEALRMTMTDEARTLIVVLSQGLPHYTHVLGKTSTMHAVHDLRWEIIIDDVKASITAAIESTEQSVRNSYQQATTSPRKDTIFRQVLLACDGRCRRAWLFCFSRRPRAALEDHGAKVRYFQFHAAPQQVL